MAMGGWKLIVEVCLPIPFILIILMTIPAPRWFHRGVLSVVDKTLGLTFVGTLSLLHIMLIVTGVSFLASIKTTSDLLATKPIDADASPNVIAGHLGRRWRAERNFWISFICFTLWCLLARFFQIMKKNAKIEDELRAHKLNSAAPTPTKPEVDGLRTSKLNSSAPTQTKQVDALHPSKLNSAAAAPTMPEMAEFKKAK